MPSGEAITMINPEYPDFLNNPASMNRPIFGYRLRDNTSKPYVTIVTPFFNSGPIFHETVQSVLQQSFQQWEWLIIDDGSTDPASLEILKSYRDKDSRIRVFTQLKNKGNSAARNLGVGCATAPYVVLLDTDDLLEPTAIEKWWWFLESYSEFAFAEGYSVGFGAYQYVWKKGFHHGRTFLEENLATMSSMVRKNVYQSVDGFDESMGKTGLNDWEFWLRCANSGYWGGVVPEHLNWYRRRVDHTDRWPAWTKEGKNRFLSQMRARYPRLWEGEFPQIESQVKETRNLIPNELPCENRLQKAKPRILFVVSWLETDQENKFLIPMVKGLIEHGWEVSITAIQKGTHTGLHQLSMYTPDVFILPHFLKPKDYPRFLHYLIRSRQIDEVLVSNCEVGKLLLPFLRAEFPTIHCSEFIPGDEYWLNGGPSPASWHFGNLLDQIIVPSRTVKSWMVQQGAHAGKVHVLNHVIDMGEPSPDSHKRSLIRSRLGFVSEVPLILYAAHFSTRGRPNLFANTVLKLYKEGLRFVAVAVGDGPYLEWLSTFSHKHGLDDTMRVLGAVSVKRLNQLMMAADIFFQPSILPGTELSMYKAMACSLAVVGAKWEQEAPKATPDCGILIEPGSEEIEIEQYTSTLARLIQDFPQPKDNKRADRYKVKTQFSLEKIGEELHTLLQKVMNQPPQVRHPVINKKTGRQYALRAVECLRLSHWSEDLIEQQRGIITRQERENASLEEHRALWEGVAAERETIIKKQEQDKAWLEEHRALWEGVAAEREAIIKKQEREKEHLYGKFWVRLGLHLDRILRCSFLTKRKHEGEYGIFKVEMPPDIRPPMKF